MKECPFCLGEAWHVDANTWECTMCGREFEADPEKESKNDNLKKGGGEMGKPGQPWSEEQRKHFMETAARKKSTAAGNPAASGGERKAKGKRDFAAEYSRRKRREKNDGSTLPKAKRAYRRRSTIDPAPAANPAPAPAKLKIFCMKCGFRMELENPDLLHTQEAP